MKKKMKSIATKVRKGAVEKVWIGLRLQGRYGWAETYTEVRDALSASDIAINNILAAIIVAVPIHKEK